MAVSGCISFLFLEILYEESELECTHVHKCIERERYFLCQYSKRERVPKVEGYVLNVVELMDEPQHIHDFRTHFRVSRELFTFILNELSYRLHRNGHGPQVNVPPGKQLLVALWYISNTASIREVAHVFGLSMHGIMKDVCDAIAQLGNRVIQWPSPEQQQQNGREVQDICSLPGVVGFIDGTTHIRLSSVLQGEKDYYNRRGFPSIQLQIVVDHNMKFLNCYTGCPWCVHDARVLRHSGLYHKAEAGELVILNFHILEDNAYPQRNWLITPLKNVGQLTRQQITFNKRLSSVM